MDMSDLPGKDEFVKRIRKINGQTDPNDDSDEAKQAEEQRAQAEADQQKKQQQQQELEMQNLAEKVKSEREKARQTSALTDGKRVEIMEKAVALAQQMAANPELAPMAEELLSIIEQEAAQ